MSESMHSEEEPLKVSVDLNPLADVSASNEAEDANTRADIQQMLKRAEEEEKQKEATRRAGVADTEATDLTATPPDGEKVAAEKAGIKFEFKPTAEAGSTRWEVTEDPSVVEGVEPIARWKLGHSQKEAFQRMWMNPAERKGVIDAMGINTRNGVKYGPAFAAKVEKFQKEKLGFTWDDPEAVKAGRVPNGIIDEATILAMSKLPDVSLPFDKEVIARLTDTMFTISVDRRQERLFQKLGFTREQTVAFGKLLGQKPTSFDSLKQMIADFQITKLGFLNKDAYELLTPKEREGKGLADGYFGKRSMRALQEKGMSLFQDDPAKQEAVSVLLGKKVDKAA